MSDSLPERPDLRQLRSRAKELRDSARRGDAAAVARMTRHHPGVAGDAVPLAAAQLVIARELGFPSWPRLVAVIEAGAAARRVAADFVSASVEGRMQRASEIRQADPGIAGSSLLAASVLGEAGAVREHLAASPAAAVAIDDERGWPPLLYACYSRWHQIDPGAAAGLGEVVRLLLANGASADTNDGGQPRFRSALKGSVEVNNPAITAALLDAGANPDLGQPIAEAAAHRDLRCLRLLLSRGARVAGTWAVGSAVFHDDPNATALLLQAFTGSGRRAEGAATEALLDAAGTASFPVIEALLNAGADPQARDGDGVSALRLAVRAGKEETAARLRALGAADDATDVDLFLGVCLNGDRQAAERVLAAHPDLPGRLTDQDQAVICDAAASRDAGTLALMLELGFPPHAASSASSRCTAPPTTETRPPSECCWRPGPR
jgi:ankyrin repeat protein